MSFVQVIIIYSLLVSVGRVSSLTIKNETKKSCTVLTDKGTVDLTPAAKTDGKSAAFITPMNGQGSGASNTRWNPCVDTTIPSLQCNVPGEIFVTNPSYRGCNSLATAKDATFTTKDGKLQLDYREIYGQKIHILLICSSSIPKDPFVQQETCWDKFEGCYTLTHPVCCFKAADTAKLSAGSILLITVLVLAVLYVVGGVLFMKFVKKAEGAEIFPNILFWKSLPFMVKDGFLYVIRCGKQK